MFTMQEIAALKVALKRNSKEHLEDWIARWESKNGDLLLEQFEKGISQEIQIQIYYHENDNYDGYIANDWYKVIDIIEALKNSF